MISRMLSLAMPWHLFRLPLHTMRTTSCIKVQEAVQVALFERYNAERTLRVKIRTPKARQIKQKQRKNHNCLIIILPSCIRCITWIRSRIVELHLFFWRELKVIQNLGLGSWVWMWMWMWMWLFRGKKTMPMTMGHLFLFIIQIQIKRKRKNKIGSRPLQT